MKMLWKFTMKVRLWLNLSALFLFFSGCVSERMRQHEEWAERFRTEWRTGVEKEIEMRLSERQRYVSGNSNLDPAIANAIVSGSIARGMTIEEFLMSWGQPDRANQSVGSWGESWQCYYDFSDTSYGVRQETINPELFNGEYYIYFKNGLLDSWQWL